MPISLLEQKKKYKFLVPILGGIILLTLIIFWAGFFKNRVPQGRDEGKDEATPHRSSEININWEILKNPILETLEGGFDEIPPWPGAPGRKNPFLPY